MTHERGLAKTCKKGHSYDGTENARARRGCCPHCFREVQRRYSKTAKGRATQARYDVSDKGQDRHHRYQSSPKGWLNRLQSRRAHALGRRTERVTKQEAEDSNGTL